MTTRTLFTIGNENNKASNYIKNPYYFYLIGVTITKFVLLLLCVVLDVLLDVLLVFVVEFVVVLVLFVLLVVLLVLLLLELSNNLGLFLS